MARSTIHYADNKTNNALKKLHNKLRPAGTPVQRVEYIIELLLLRIFETRIKQDEEFKPLRKLFTSDYRWKNPRTGKEESNENRLFSYLPTVSNDQILVELNDNFFPFYSSILQSARQVFEKNLPQKVQDQLVLIEEVFSNSNFTNNVNSGNLGEVINIVANDIEEHRLLKTDLLGDAIESALSETGGTNDVGLFRTPGHVRQFMTALIEPTFDDLIFDPACGTGGFLFDAFEFVMRRVDPTREWPGEKANSELAEWFDKYFEDNKIEFPSIEQTTQFYRTGVTGIEYLGMIRKMAAINFYIRGLNPANIEQGDSLAKYRPVTDHETKSIILANPPFGAQRDQEAYPDVWSEYSKESETTILFVKLMFEHLKQGGQCAVVVSEGFHTWDQFSAKTLRKMLLEEAHLKAVISLPQGLFVSKNGQGPKTSILIFEKGGKTDWTWFYKITNDGYTMGTNRKEQKGNQLVECLKLYHEFVKLGKKPVESKNQFCIPSDWIKTLDPRIKEKIRTETRADMEAKGKNEKDKKAEELDKKIKAKKITIADKQIELKVFDQMIENRIQNEIAKRIDKAHNYSFNFANYKSAISESQIAEWAEALKHIQPNGATTLDEVYKRLRNSKPENILPYLLKLNPANALEADIAREYISNLDNDLILNHKELNVIKEILKSKLKYPIEKLEGKVNPKYVKIKKDNYFGEIDIVDKISFKDGKVHFRDVNETGMDLFQAEKGDLITSKINVHQGSLALADRKLVCSTHYQVYEIDQTQINPDFLVVVLRSNQLQTRVNEIKNKGIKNEQGAEFLLSLEIPIPSLDEQKAIITQIERQKAIIEGVEKVIKNWSIDLSEYLIDIELVAIGNAVLEAKNGWSPVCKGGNQAVLSLSCLQNGNIDFSKVKYTDEQRTDISKFYVEKGDFFYSRGNTKDLVALAAIAKTDVKKIVFPDLLTKVKFNEKLILPEFAVLCFNSKLGRDYFGNVPEGASPSMVKVSQSYMMDFKVPFLNNISLQRQILAELDSQIQILEGLRKMKSKAEKKIGRILGDVWGIDFVEPVKMEVEDEQEN
jgi:type I restriction-modification system DNA methylase subunit